MPEKIYLIYSKYLLLEVIGILLVAPVCFSCKTGIQSDPNSSKQIISIEKNLVDAIILARQDFTREILSNGKLSATRSAAIWFRNGGIIESVQVINGQAVQAGSLLARLQPEDYLTSLKKAEASFGRASIERLNAFMSMGYKQTDSASINPEHRKIAEIKSGYTEALINLEEARRQFDGISLYAPFAGKAEGIVQKPWEKADLSKPFCILIDDAAFSVKFPLLEAEVGQVHVGQPVVVSPVSGSAESIGTITSINPRVDENGLAWLTAGVKNPGGYLEGMNVKVSIRKILPGRLVVPKQAVVIRQDRHVLFCYKGGIAWWTYVEVLDENEHSYSVEASPDAKLAEGDTVIVSNNLNLAHESPVEIK